MYRNYNYLWSRYSRLTIQLSEYFFIVSPNYTYNTISNSITFISHVWDLKNEINNFVLLLFIWWNCLWTGIVFRYNTVLCGPCVTFVCIVVINLHQKFSPSHIHLQNVKKQRFTFLDNNKLIYSGQCKLLKLLHFTNINCCMQLI